MQDRDEPISEDLGVDLQITRDRRRCLADLEGPMGIRYTPRFAPSPLFGHCRAALPIHSRSIILGSPPSHDGTPLIVLDNRFDWALVPL